MDAVVAGLAAAVDGTLRATKKNLDWKGSKISKTLNIYHFLRC